MTGAARIALLYAAFSAIATAANLGAQWLVIALYHGPYAVPISVLVGTATGLPIKYALEKRHVFEFETRSLSHDSRLFVLYTALGALTTLVFWGIEWAFHHAFGTDGMRYLGGAIGLTLGSVMKYHLDKRFVFVHRAPAAA